MYEMNNWNSICRVCASPAEYEVFEKIPAYLHANLNEFLNWQKPINVMLEETTGIKCTEDDGMPRKICAICISYLKHAVSFRDQYINNSLGLKAVQLLQQQNEKNNASASSNKRNVDKDDSLLVTAEELIFNTERHTDANLLNTTNNTQDQNKVCKQLLNNNFQAANAPVNQQNMEQQMRYLNLLFNKDTNAGLQAYQRGGRNTDDVDLYNDDNAVGGGGINSDPYMEEDFQTESSSGEENYEATSTTRDKSNLFSYTEKNFEEDDIMNIEHLRDAITINIPESCKERKCRACCRRFMFEDSYTEHMSTCIEHKFLEYIEENCRLLALRRAKRISPHEFIRRMIFCIRKTCEWLKKANCGDILLPDLLQNNNNDNSIMDNKSKGGGGDADVSSGLENAQTRKSSTESSTAARQQPTQIFPLTEENILQTQYDLPKNMNNTNLTDLLLNTHISTESYASAVGNDTTTLDGNNLFNTITQNKARRSKSRTPITIENNILYEIERSQSRSSNNMPLSDLELDIADVITQIPPTSNIADSVTAGNDTNKDVTARASFLQKLQKAANESPTTAASTIIPNQPDKSFIRVRKDLLNPNISNDFRQSPNSSGDLLLKPIPITPPHVGVDGGGFSARCNPCNLLFGTLAALEIHNAMQHNNRQATTPSNQLPIIPTAAKTLDEVEREAEHQRIIALFEDEED